MQLFKTLTASTLAIALAASGVSVAQAQTTGSGLGSVVNCDAPGTQQRNGAILGGLLGAAAGVAVAKKDGQGAVLGGLLGAAAGSYVGCQKQREQQAQTYDPNAYAYGNSQYDRYDGYQQTGYADRMPLARGVQQAHVIASQEQLRVASNVNLRAAPSASSAKVGQLYAGQTFESLGMVRGSDWLLVGRNGVGVGYVKQSYVQPADYGRYAGGYGR